MAMADYRLCDVCGNKAFYDSNLNYEFPGKDIHGNWVQAEHVARVAGKEQDYGYGLDRVGDWAVICIDCAKTYKTIVVEI